jgi:hypothetical protein
VSNHRQFRPKSHNDLFNEYYKSVVRAIIEHFPGSEGQRHLDELNEWAEEYATANGLKIEDKKNSFMK